MFKWCLNNVAQWMYCNSLTLYWKGMTYMLGFSSLFHYDSNWVLFLFIHILFSLIQYVSHYNWIPRKKNSINVLENHWKSNVVCFCCPSQLRLINLLLMPVLSLQLRTNPKRTLLSKVPQHLWSRVWRRKLMTKVSSPIRPQRNHWRRQMRTTATMLTSVRREVGIFLLSFSQSQHTLIYWLYRMVILLGLKEDSGTLC